MLLKQAIDQFTNYRKFIVKKNTVYGYDRELKVFCLFLRNPEIETIKINDIMDYLNQLKELGWRDNSFILKCTALRKLFEFYRRQGFNVLDEELIPIPPKEYNLPRVAKEKDYKRLLKAIPKKSNDPRHIRNLSIVTMLWDTGARNGEIANLNVDEIDTKECKAVIRTEKSKGQRPFREIFWTHTTNNYLKKWIAKRKHLSEKGAVIDDKALFLSCCSQKVGQRIEIKGISAMLSKYSGKAKLPIVMNAHSFRHHLGHHIIEQGGSNSDVSNILGHSSLESSKIYTMMTGQELKRRWRCFNER